MFPHTNIALDSFPSPIIIHSVQLCFKANNKFIRIRRHRRRRTLPKCRRPADTDCGSLDYRPGARIKSLRSRGGFGRRNATSAAWRSLSRREARAADRLRAESEIGGHLTEATRRLAILIPHHY